MNISDAFPSTYLKAADLKGTTIAVTIARVTFEAVGTEREQRAIVYFVGKTKGVVLNKVNSRTIVDIAGSPLTEDWTGVAIALYPTTTEYQGAIVDCIRMKPVARSQPPIRVPPPVVKAALPVIQLQAPIADDEIPF